MKNQAVTIAEALHSVNRLFVYWHHASSHTVDAHNPSDQISCNTGAFFVLFRFCCVEDACMQFFKRIPCHK